VFPQSAMPRRHAAIVVVVVAAVSCTNADNTKQRQPVQPVKAALAGGLTPLPMYLTDLVQYAGAFNSYIKTVESTTPRQNAHKASIKRDPSVPCTGAKARLTFESFATEGAYSHAALTSADGQTEFGFAVGVVDNETACVPISIPLPAQTATDGGAAIIFIGLAKPANPADPKSIRLYVVDSTTRAILADYEFKACDPGANHPWFGDHMIPKKLANNEVCDHGNPNKSLTAATPSGAKQASASTSTVMGSDIDDPWALWISCAADCCYADPGTRGGGRGDSTHTDTTHRDTTHRDTTHKP
jgi:hypothetical protein